MTKKTTNKLKSPNVFHKKRALTYRKKTRISIDKLRLEDTVKTVLLALLGIGGRSERLLWCEAYAGWMAGKLLAQLMLGFRTANPGKQFFFVTFKDECGITSDRLPHVRLKELEDKVRRALATLKVSGVVVLEVHPLANYPGGGAGRTLLYHAHAIIWADTPFNEKTAMGLLNSSRAWSNSLGADPVHIVPIGDSPRDLQAVTLYMCKRPYSVKNRMPDDKHPGRFILMDTIAGYRDEFALRVFEGLTQVDLMDTIFGVGEGRAIRQTLNADMRKWHHARSTVGTIVPASTDIWALWLKLRQAAGSKNFAPYRFDTSPVPKPLSQKKVKARRRRQSALPQSRRKKCALRPLGPRRLN